MGKEYIKYLSTKSVGFIYISNCWLKTKLPSNCQSCGTADTSRTLGCIKKPGCKVDSGMWPDSLSLFLTVTLHCPIQRDYKYIFKRRLKLQWVISVSLVSPNGIPKIMASNRFPQHSACLPLVGETDNYTSNSRHWWRLCCRVRLLRECLTMAV